MNCRFWNQKVADEMDGASRDDLLTKAVALHQQGSLNQAESLYRQLQRQLQDDQPDDNLSYLLGTLLLQKGQAEQAVELLKPASQRQAHSPDLHNNLGLAYQSLRKFPEAVSAFRAAIRANPKFLQAHLNLGKAFVESGEWGEAESGYRLALSCFPEQAEIQTEIQQELAAVLVNLQDWQGAAEVLKQLYLGSNGNAAQRSAWLSQLAFAESQAKNDVEALKWYQELVSYYPESAELASNIGYLQERLGFIDQAVETLSAAVRFNTQQPEIYNNLGIALRTAHQFDRAEEAFRRAVELRPEFHLARFNHGTLLLLTGNYSAGWRDYEARLKMVPPPVEFENIPVWRGECLSGQRLLVYADQGFGDAIQFARFLTRIKQRSQAEIVLHCSPNLTGLFEQSRLEAGALADRFVNSQADLQDIAACFPLMSAGDVLDLTEADFSFASPYIQAKNLRETLETELNGQEASVAGEKQPGPFKIGICWRGNSAQGQDRVRSMLLASWLPLAELRSESLEIEWHNLQWDMTAEEQACWPVTLHNQMDEIRGFDETAELISMLDLVLTVDTAVAHLSGALGQTTWTLLAHTPDWRWRISGESSPWYPGMKLIRQPKWGDWESVIRQVGENLSKLLETT